MAETKQKNNLETCRNFALYFTMTAAILTGAVWLITMLTNSNSSTVDTISSILVGATAVGGIVMGLLYVVHLSKK